MIKLPHPLLTNEDLEKLRHVNRPGFKAATLPILFRLRKASMVCKPRWRLCLPTSTAPLPRG